MDEQPAPAVPYLLAYAFTVATRQANEALRQHNLTIRQFGVLVQLDLEPELTMSDLARQLGVTRQSLHEMVGALEQAGYLRRLPGSSGRTRRLELTRGTRRLMNQVDDRLRLVEEEFLGGLRASEIHTLRTLLRRLLAHATDDESWLGTP
ncbi:MarR family transcriptional regulator [Actinoalloteichus sp. AHMU CJ021]|uniref:DNA-binding transcriptional regulator, MarR family n=1 Tax=Actinoalloteichus caeruleus DSM 43889 TaxID=1120930 RepID=A0ABT1JMU1_ACTCY|nr:MarR family transcriptional regulator [Actinoalloteichus caeruleus]AUS79635.1 MarR family transcriptional regulator [Actinoalloteichus sp. AHMU CJ021]MCP2333831.1 DNA-binding transcriptional regulator, MarR family [Actinoalloteichus caeruleus DSM 43889]